jgi:uncharacterized protein (TIGR02246 family)
MRIKLLTIVIILTLISCNLSSNDNHPFDKEVVRQEMKNLVMSYGQAVENMDIEKTINHFSDDSEFYAYSDGRHYTYDEIKESVKNEFYKGLKKVELKWDTINVRALDAKEAVCFAILNQTLLDSAENEIKVRVEATFIGVKKHDTWKIAYVHSRHKLITN